MIFGRPTNLWNAAVGLLLNVIIYFHLFGVVVDAPGVTILNGALLAFIGLIANTPNTAPPGQQPSILGGSPGSSGTGGGTGGRGGTGGAGGASGQPGNPGFPGSHGGSGQANVQLVIIVAAIVIVVLFIAKVTNFI
jgi:hypothetical protein